MNGELPTRSYAEMVGQPYRKSGLPPARDFPCALAGWPGGHGRCTPPMEARNWMVWDHCHLHGFIRGALCAQHNRDVIAVRHADRDSRLRAYELNCPGCAAFVARIAAAIARRALGKPATCCEP